MDPTLMSAERVIEMATINGAKAIGLEHEIGSLETGKRADIVAFDLFKPHAMVGNKPISQLVFSGHGTDVDTVMVNGALKLRGGEWVGFDREHEVLAEAQARAAEVIERAGIADRVFVDWRH
jgi:cytosine/adenosine deaminase-related metal-dependent hydrolase